MFYRSWAALLPSDVELLAVQYPGRLDRIAHPCIDDMTRMATTISDAIAREVAEPFALFGHSMGAAVAFEVARRLEQGAGPAPARLFVSGRPAPSRCRSEDFHLGTDEALWAHVRGLGGTDDEALANRELRAMLTPMVRSDYRLVETYLPTPGRPLTCTVTALTGRDDLEVRVEEAEAWREVTTGAFDLDVFPGEHFYLVSQRAALLPALVRRLSIAARA